MSNKKKGNANSGAKGKSKEAVDDWDSILEAEIKANQQQTQTQTVAPTETDAPDVSDIHRLMNQS